MRPPLERRSRLLATLLIVCLVGTAACGGTPQLAAESGAHALRGCISSAAGFTTDDPATRDEDSAPFFRGLAAAQQHDGRGYFSGWLEKVDSARRAKQVDFLFYADDDAAEKGVAAARNRLLRDGEQTPSTAERHGNLVMYFTGPLPQGQRFAIDDCLKAADADDGAKPEAILSAADRTGIEQRQERRFKALDAAALKEARAPALLAALRRNTVGDCLNGTDAQEGRSRTELAAPGSGDKYAAPALSREVEKLDGGLVSGYRFSVHAKDGELSEPKLPHGWDYVFLPDEAAAQRLETAARAEVAKRWPEGSVVRDGQVLTLMAQRFPASSRKILSGCLESGQHAVERALREAQEAYG